MKVSRLLTLAAALCAVLVFGVGIASAQPVIVATFADMEHGDPFDASNGWFSWNTTGGGGFQQTIAPTTPPWLPPADGGALSMQTGWGGTPSTEFGGFGRTNLTNLTGADTFNFWIRPTAVGQTFTIQINLQDDDDGDGAITVGPDDEFQFDCVVSPVGPCAVSDDTWQLVTVPLAAFIDDNSYFNGGDGILNGVPGGLLVNVALAIVGGPADAAANFLSDYWSFTTGPLPVEVTTFTVE